MIKSKIKSDIPTFQWRHGSENLVDLRRFWMVNPVIKKKVTQFRTRVSHTLQIYRFKDETQSFNLTLI